VNIRRVLLDRLGNQGVDQADDGGVVVALEQVFRFGQFARDIVEIEFPADFLGLVERGFSRPR
jgi:hypothetical protein